MSNYQSINGETVRLGFADEPKVNPNIIDLANGACLNLENGAWNMYDIDGDLIGSFIPGTPYFEKWQAIHSALTALSNENSMMHTIRISSRQLAIILAALRAFQEHPNRNDHKHFTQLEGQKPVEPRDIDDICEQINA